MKLTIGLTPKCYIGNYLHFVSKLYEQFTIVVLYTNKFKILRQQNYNVLSESDIFHGNIIFILFIIFNVIIQIKYKATTVKIRVIHLNEIFDSFFFLNTYQYIRTIEKYNKYLIAITCRSMQL